MNKTELENQIEQGLKVKWIRSQLGWTQLQMVTYLKKIDRTNQSNYCNMENGKLPLLWRYEAILILFRNRRSKLISKIEKDILIKRQLIDKIKSI